MCSLANSYMALFVLSDSALSAFGLAVEKRLGGGAGTRYGDGAVELGHVQGFVFGQQTFDFPCLAIFVGFDLKVFVVGDKLFGRGRS